MPIQLTEVEARVLGSLVEKSLTTPEQYPLSLNSLTNACNQKTSREPLMSLEEAAVGQGLFALLEKGLAERRHEPGSRVPKFLHRIDLLLGGDDPKQTAAICVLLLRGPQTPGEIKTRTDRLCEFASTAEVESLLQDLSARPDGPLVARLPRQPGQKESRYQQLFSAAAPAAVAPPDSDRVGKLERRVDALEALVKSLEGRLPKPG